MPVLRLLNQNFFKIWSHEIAYILGYFAADGSMLVNNRGAHFIEFVSTDRLLIDQIKRVCNSNHLVSERRRSRNCKIAYRIQIGSKEWFKDLLQIGFTQAKSNTLSFPVIPDAVFGDFIRGYFDGDGCVYFKQHRSKSHQSNVWVLTTRFSSGSKNFLLTLQAHLKRYGACGGYLNYKKKEGMILYLVVVTALRFTV